MNKTGWCERVKAREFGVRFTVICYRLARVHARVIVTRELQNRQMHWSQTRSITLRTRRETLQSNDIFAEMRSAIDCVPSTTPSRNACPCLSTKIILKKKIPRP